MTDFTILSRTVLALLWTYPASNPFLLARLAGHSECDVVSVLGELERKGLIAESNGRWSLSSQGLEACRPPAHRNRPGSAVQHRLGRPPARHQR